MALKQIQYERRSLRRKLRYSSEVGYLSPYFPYAYFIRLYAICIHPITNLINFGFGKMNFAPQSYKEHEEKCESNLVVNDLQFQFDAEKSVARLCRFR